MVALLNFCQFFRNSAWNASFEIKSWTRFGTSCHIEASKYGQSSASMKKPTPLPPKIVLQWPLISLGCFVDCLGAWFQRVNNYGITSHTDQYSHLRQAQNGCKYLRARVTALNGLFNLREGIGLQKLTLLAKHYESSVFKHSRYLLWTSIYWPFLRRLFEDSCSKGLQMTNLIVKQIKFPLENRSGGLVVALRSE